MGSGSREREVAQAHTSAPGHCPPHCAQMHTSACSGITHGSCAAEQSLYEGLDLDAISACEKVFQEAAGTWHVVALQVVMSHSCERRELDGREKRRGMPSRPFHMSGWRPLTASH